MSRFERTELFLGKDALEKLNNARVAVMGLGGVGGAAAEALLRAGIGHLLFVDGDTVDQSNINRQILATEETVGMDKIAAAKKRFCSINPDADMTFIKEFYLPDSDIFRNLVVIKKVKETPKKYPRKAGMPTKEPIC